MIVARLVRKGVGRHPSYGRAARETAKLSSSIWNRVIFRSEIIRMIAKAVSMILPVAETFEAQGAENDRAALVRHDGLDVEADWLGETAHIAKEVGDCVATRLSADPGQRPDITRYLKFGIVAEECGDLVRLGTSADTGKQLLGDVGVFVSAHGCLLGKGGFRDLHLLLEVVGNGSQPRSPFIFLSFLGERLGEGVNPETISLHHPSPSLSPKGERRMRDARVGRAVMPRCVRSRCGRARPRRSRRSGGGRTWS